MCDDSRLAASDGKGGSLIPPLPGSWRFTLPDPVSGSKLNYDDFFRLSIAL